MDLAQLDAEVRKVCPIEGLGLLNNSEDPEKFDGILKNWPGAEFVILGESIIRIDPAEGATEPQRKAAVEAVKALWPTTA